MPLTFIDIERQKSFRIWVFFLVLLFIYFLITLIFAYAFSPVFFIRQLSIGFFSSGDNLIKLLIIAAFSIIIASIHLFFSAFGAVRSVARNLSASPPDKEDGIHRQLIDIVEEIHVVTGNKRKMGCMVVPSLSLNALAVADLKGDAAIMITEGLLSRLTRPQLECVMAHEAHHILSGDCMETTVAASLFGMYASAMEKLRNLSEGRAVLSPPLLLAWILLKFSNLLNLFISREREYRADAGSVRMTRNPLAMAEALNLISRNWRGAGFIGNGLEMLCIVNPKTNELDESEGFWADLMSTHPPIRKRIDILLKMAHAGIGELQKKMEQKPGIKVSEPVYYALDPRQQWEGPFGLAELSSMPWFSPLTWVSSGDGSDLERAWKNPLMDAVFTGRLSCEEDNGSDFVCPNCRQRLINVSYEKTNIFQCRFCGGVLVGNDKIPRIVIRREKPCTDRVKSLARAVLMENQIEHTRRMLRVSERKKVSLLPCSKCKNPMTRKFYSLAYLIEIDMCGVCSLTWFDADELEMLQCIVENKITPEINPSPV